MESLGWRQRWGSSPAARRGARQRAGLTPVSASNTLSCKRETLHANPPLTLITVSTATKKLPIVAVATLITLILSAGLVTTGELLRASAGGAAPDRIERRSEPTVDLAARTRAAMAGRRDDEPAALRRGETVASAVGNAARERR